MTLILLIIPLIGLSSIPIQTNYSALVLLIVIILIIKIINSEDLGVLYVFVDIKPIDSYLNSNMVLKYDGGVESHSNKPETRSNNGVSANNEPELNSDSEESKNVDLDNNSRAEDLEGMGDSMNTLFTERGEWEKESENSNKVEPGTTLNETKELDESSDELVESSGNELVESSGDDTIVPTYKDSLPSDNESLELDSDSKIGSENNDSLSSAQNRLLDLDEANIELTEEIEEKIDDCISDLTDSTSKQLDTIQYYYGPIKTNLQIKVESLENSNIPQDISDKNYLINIIRDIECKENSDKIYTILKDCTISQQTKAEFTELQQKSEAIKQGFLDAMRSEILEGDSNDLQEVNTNLNELSINDNSEQGSLKSKLDLSERGDSHNSNTASWVEDQTLSETSDLPARLEEYNNLINLYPIELEEDEEEELSTPFLDERPINRDFMIDSEQTRDPLIELVSRPTISNLQEAYYNNQSYISDLNFGNYYYHLFNRYPVNRIYRFEEIDRVPANINNNNNNNNINNNNNSNPEVNNPQHNNSELNLNSNNLEINLNNNGQSIAGTNMLNNNPNNLESNSSLGEIVRNSTPDLSDCSTVSEQSILDPGHFSEIASVISEILSNF